MRYILIAFLIFFWQDSLGQSGPGSSVIPPSEGNKENESIEDKLVRLAWENYPVNDVYKQEVEIAKRELNMAGWTWTRNLSVFYNANDQTLNEQNQQRFSGRPMYGLGVSVNLGDLISIPNNVNIAKEEYKIAVSSQEAQKLDIRSQVLKLYNEYKLATEILKIRISSMNETQTNLHVVEENFKEGDASITEYNEAIEQFNSTKENKLSQETKVKNIKIDLEQFIGVPLEQVLNESR